MATKPGGGALMCWEQRVCEADREYLFQHFMNRRGAHQMNTWGPESEAPITRGIEFVP